MYISPKKKKTYTIISLILLFSIPLGIIGFKYFTDWRSGASVSPTPEDVRISDLTETSVTLSWVTPDKAAEGWVKYSTDSTLGDDAQISQDYRDISSGQTTTRTTHYVTVSDLSPETKYYFSIGSGGSEYKDSSGNAFDFTTASSGSYTSPPSPDPVYGTVTNGEDQSAIVYITLGTDSNKSFPISSITNDSGNFEIDLSHVRTASLSGNYSYDDSTGMSVMAQGGDRGGAVVETTAGVDNSLTLTMDEDFSTTTFFADSSSVDVSDDSSDYLDTSQSSDTSSDDDNDVTLTSMDLPETVSASSDIENIFVTNVTENSFSVIWESDQKESGYLIYGTDSGSLSSEAVDDRDSLTSKASYYIHHVTAEDLSPETKYYYKIVSGSTQYSNSGNAYYIQTPATQSSPPASRTIVGEVTGTAQSDAVVMAKLVKSSADSSYVSATSDLDGDWIIDLGSLRTSNYSAYFDIEDTDTLVITGLAGGDSDVSSYTLSDADGQVLGVSLDINKEESVISELPETAIHGIAAIAVTVSVVLIIYGVTLLGNYYHDERKTRWEKSFLDGIGDQ